MAADTSIGQSLIAGPPRPLAAHAAILPDLVAWAEQIAGLTQTGHTADALAAMLIHSRHLQTIARAQQDAIVPILSGQGDDIIVDAIAALQAAAECADDDDSMMAAIRRLRQRSALAVALSDLADMHPVPIQMRWLSDAADAAIASTVRYLLRQATLRGQIDATEESADMACGWTILALGKLGARELNYSSDVDLIILHDPDSSILTRPETSQAFFVDMTRRLVRLLSTATRDGIGWRVDLRLRPDPGATAVSIQRDAAIGYYESIARTWERAAFIRARPVAGDLEMGKAFLDDLQPFIWRKTLDYTVIDDMATMLSRPPSTPGWPGFNLKTGRGGIRNIEFFTHVLQLVGGGRSPALRQPSTPDALASLATGDWISTEQQTALAAHYNHLRRIEHRLQMLADAQTHALPRSLDDIADFAAFLGHDSADMFLQQLATICDAVVTYSAHPLFDDGDTADTAPPLEDEDRMKEWLANKGFSRPEGISHTLSGWMAGRIATTRSERARTLLSRMMPDILDQLAQASDPDDCFAAFAGFVEGLPASVQIFSLLDHNRQLGRLLGDILILSPRLAGQLRRYPMMFDLVIASDFFSPLDDADGFEKHMRAAIAKAPVEEALEIVTRLTRERRFRAEVQALSGVADLGAMGRALANTAAAAIRVVASLATADMERRHGKIDGGFAVLGLGRIGTGNMTATSDIDLVFVWEGPDDALSDGTRALAARSYFTRLAQTLVSWLGGATAEGSLYSVDVRLRPDGEKGALAPSCQRLFTYYSAEAWTWEWMALAKARCLTPGPTGKAAMQVIDKLMTTPPDAAAIANAAHQMVARFRDSYGNAPAWQLRRQPGGIREMDLLLQGLRLQHASLFTGADTAPDRIMTTLETAGQISTDRAAALREAQQLFESLHQAMRLVRGSSDDIGTALPDAAMRFILAACDCPDTATLDARLEGYRGQVMSALESLFPPPQDS
ncbi:MAG: bifunctional [glutamine synthetase] adenylyltransferase/[glutamine synthetase]-adenylyl-L-tyrosine phosphorylase [Candidatus Puniceispirillaceae bacterium]